VRDIGAEGFDRAGSRGMLAVSSRTTPGTTRSTAGEIRSARRTRGSCGRLTWIDGNRTAFRTASGPEAAGSPSRCCSVGGSDRPPPLRIPAREGDEQ